MIFTAALASKHGDAIDDAIDIAIIGKVKEREEELNRFTVERFKPFDPISKRTEATIRSPEGVLSKAAKGAPQVVCIRCMYAHEVN